MKRQKKYNIIIFTTLFLAIILLLLAGRSYLTNKDEEVQTEVDTTESNKEINREITEENNEPEEMQIVDKTDIIKKYLDSLEDQIQKNKIITYKMINSWGDYSVGDIIYQRKIDNGYYEYKVDILIPESDAKLPCSKNEELSSDEVTVITLYFDIIDSEKSNGYIIKNIDLIEE